MKSFARIIAIVTVILVLEIKAIAQDDAAGTPLEGVTQDMKVATTQLSKKTTDNRTQTPQEAAVTKLDALIVALEKERRGLGAGANPTIPADSSTIRQGPGGMGDLRGAKEQGNRWGDLPAHERDRILQSLTEGFPAHYQGILEAYYKRLAVEKKAETDEPAVKETKSDSKSNEPKMVAPPTMKPATATKKVSP